MPADGNDAHGAGSSSFQSGGCALRVTRDALGWSWLFPPYRWHLDAVARGAVAAIGFDGACLRGKCDADHELGYQLMGRLADLMLRRLIATRLQLLDVYAHGSR